MTFLQRYRSETKGFQIHASDSDCADCEGHFSWSPCDTCGAVAQGLRATRRGVRVNLSWREGMARAYSRGLADGKVGTFNVYNGEGFDACYFQGVGHGAQRCLCPPKLAARFTQDRCPTCGQPKETPCPSPK